MAEFAQEKLKEFEGEGLKEVYRKKESPVETLKRLATSKKIEITAKEQKKKSK